MKGLVLSGGHGTRLRPLTHTSAKQLIPVANKPVLFYALEDVRECGITDVGIIVASHSKEAVIDAVGNGSQFAIKVTYIEQDEPRGLAHAVKIARDFLQNEPFVMYLGDNILKEGIVKLCNYFTSAGCDALIAVSRVKNPQRFGVVEIKHGKVVRLVEKPKVPMSDLALAGIYFFRASIFKAIDHIKPSWRNELEITDAIQQLIDMGYRVDYKEVTGWWKDTGKPEDIIEVNQLLLKEISRDIRGMIEENVSINGEIIIDEGSIIKTGCKLLGPIIIGKNCVIGPNTYIGPYTSVGDNCQIIGGEIENSIIIGESYIDCGRRIVESLIGRNSKITSAEKNLPGGSKLILGEHSYISI
ncbi:MAG: glucose-1-phosphate thymidylyltransferase [Candidatus Helarchaeota archaeon]